MAEVFGNWKAGDQHAQWKMNPLVQWLNEGRPGRKILHGGHNNEWNLSLMKAMEGTKLFYFNFINISNFFYQVNWSPTVILLCLAFMVFAPMLILVTIMLFITTDFKLSLMLSKANSRDGLMVSGKCIFHPMARKLIFSDHEVEAAKNALLVKLESALSDPVARADNLAVQVRPIQIDPPKPNYTF